MAHILKQTRMLNDGNTIPCIGFGTYKMENNNGKSSIIKALNKGFRLIDTASHYDNEIIVGEAIRESEVSRKEISLTTKLWRTSLSYDGALRAFEASVKRLQTDYIDLYLIHWPANAKNYPDWEKANAEAWSALEDLQKDGKIKSIGVSNFWKEHLEALFKTAHIIPAVNQIEFHPGYWQTDVLAFNNQNNITTEAWSPFARGIVFHNKKLQRIAETHHKSIAQIVIRWILHHNVIPVPKSNSVSRLLNDIDVSNFELTPEEIAQVNRLDPFGFSGELPNEWPDKNPII